MYLFSTFVLQTENKKVAPVKSLDFAEHDRIFPLCIDPGAPRSVMMKRFCAYCSTVGMSACKTGVRDQCVRLLQVCGKKRSKLISTVPV